ncbi:PRK06851 family protein [Fictibacillus sp. KU28468]|nr:PRK06851 family protein [Fictibacillus sp. KU28468]UZJ80971.1 PRK06851 family protein [Fictibacillus sp. KU28468]
MLAEKGKDDCMGGKVLHYYAGGNTAKGYISLYDSALRGLNRVFLLQGGLRSDKSAFINKIGETLRAEGHTIEYLHCASNNDWTEGLIVPDAGVGIIDDAVPEILKQAASENLQITILENERTTKNLSEHNEEIHQLNMDISAKFQKAYTTFAESLKAHDDIEDIYIANMSFAKANELTNELIDLFYGEETAGKTSNVKHRFLGAATPNGAVDYIQNLTEDICKRYFIKGRAGSGKSTMLKKIAAAGEEKGYDVEIYHCGFDPNSLDMVILREKGIAIFDSTAPHEYNPERETDEIIDMYETCITSGTDEKFAAEIERTTKPYKEKMREAISYLAEARNMMVQLEDLKCIRNSSISVSLYDLVEEEIKLSLKQNK